MSAADEPGGGARRTAGKRTRGDRRGGPPGPGRGGSRRPGQSPQKPKPRPAVARPEPQAPPAPPAGLSARRHAVHLIETVLREHRPLPRQLVGGADLASDTDAAAPAPGHAGPPSRPPLEPRDRAFAWAMAMAVLRRHGSLAAVLDRFIARPLPGEAARARSILLVAAAQILLLGTPAHAAVDLAVEHCRRDRAARRFDKLANAVLRRVAADGPAILAGLDAARADVPAWMLERWARVFGDDAARRIAEASLVEPPLDLTPRAPGDAAALAGRLGGILLPTGSIRLADHGRVETLAGYAEGAWWVQDAAAALPARLLGEVTGRRVADLCAAPGGKSAMLAAAGARVTAVDISAERLATVHRNLARLGLADRVDCVAADIEAWRPAETFDAVLLDAPCTATGTIRRHPDILHLKQPGEVERLAGLQAGLLARAAAIVKPGGTLVYCVCSLEPEEGEERIAALLASPAGAGLRRSAISPTEVAGRADWITPAGDLRTLPNHAPGPDVAGGMDGFYVARLERAGIGIVPPAGEVEERMSATGNGTMRESC